MARAYTWQESLTASDGLARLVWRPVLIGSRGAGTLSVASPAEEKKMDSQQEHMKAYSRSDFPER